MDGIMALGAAARAGPSVVPALQDSSVVSEGCS